METRPSEGWGVSASLAMLPWFPGDFMRSTRGWSLTARGVYRELLDAQWDMGQLPASTEDLAALIGATAAEWQKGWSKCESKFPITEDGMRRNERLEFHRSKSEQLTTIRSEIGRRGGQASAEAKSKQKLSNGSTLAEPNAQANGNHPSPIHSESDPNRSIPQNPPLPLPAREGRVRGSEKKPAWKPPPEPEIEFGPDGPYGVKHAGS
jgi:uncharacterized protein YdaU (DUF1376 family)